MVLLGSFASSPKMAVASKPIKEATTKTSATPRPNVKIALSPKAEMETPSGPPPETRTAIGAGSRSPRPCRSEDLPAELDIADSATEDSGGKDGRVDEPVEIRTARGLDDVVREEAKEPIHRDIDCVVGDKCNEGARNTRRSM